MITTKIKYDYTPKGNKVTLQMDLEHYKDLLKGTNHIKSMVLMMHECSDIYLSDLGKLEVLSWKMKNALGFCNHKGAEHWCDAVMSSDPNAEVKK